MRESLKEINGTRAAFTGTVARFGTKPSYKGAPKPTLMLQSVKDSKGNEVADHLWFTIGARLSSLGLGEGDVISFEARVTPYVKGYRGYREDVYVPVERDYRLSNPTKIRKV